MASSWALARWVFWAASCHPASQLLKGLDPPLVGLLYGAEWRLGEAPEYRAAALAGGSQAGPAGSLRGRGALSQGCLAGFSGWAPTEPVSMVTGKHLVARLLQRFPPPSGPRAQLALVVGVKGVEWLLCPLFWGFIFFAGGGRCSLGACFSSPHSVGKG